MSKLAALKACSSIGDLALLLGFKAQTLGYIARGLRDPAKYTSFDIPKRSGGKRTIHAPVPKLKLVQRKLCNLLEECQKEIESTLGVEKRLAHGFKKHHSIFTNADVHRRQKYVLNFDLEDFFGTINFGRVRGFFIANRHFKLNSDVAMLIAQLVCCNAKLPQGSPSSPIISNLIGNILDIRLAKLARANGCSYSRYADDITISTSLPDFPSAIASLVTGSHVWTLSSDVMNTISACGFKLNPKKTRLQYHHSRQDVTGIVVNRHVNVSSDYRRKLRAMVDRLRSTGSFTYSATELDTAASTKVSVKTGTRNQLQGMLSFALQAERYRQASTSTPAPECLTGNEKLLRRFLFYTTFASHERPLVISEGKTDGIYLASAIRSLAATFPELVAPKTGVPAVRFLRLTRSMERLFGLSGGDGPLKEFVHQYAEEYRHIKGPKGSMPVIAIFDNDTGAKGVLGLLKGFYKMPMPAGAQSVHVHGNLYVVLTSPHITGAPSHCIEDCFDAATLAITLSGKTLSLANKTLGPNEYGKAWFAEKVIKPNAKTIDFAGFNGLLGVISQIVKGHTPPPVAPPAPSSVALPLVTPKPSIP
ncbi:retron Ec67 family RNA-directed DNA polymerase/endonuclease [Pseudoxanthomonas sp. PXM04]|uniref:retron Ec67 family RNA-directed DNA polymerase/endonuclease n=1 Tax=Pseudoxanthomonas sp. PXM04 TaxID=2769297 RepID=UPI001780D9AC|nr:retron Ec67 family RNA-directed DNA polymerase/endonuclease [Pseudoxanthomonas sp. PXM04]MBD9379434.1 RNA-directed DNA polymerase [Pseudoxanthomonas sp. PXM04]